MADSVSTRGCISSLQTGRRRATQILVPRFVAFGRVENRILQINLCLCMKWMKAETRPESASAISNLMLVILEASKNILFDPSNTPSKNQLGSV